jgi:hypothetical protein
VVGVHQVDVVSLDGLFETEALPVPDVVKIDVEGHEERVLAGMGTLMERARPALVVELDAARRDRLTPRVEALEAHLHDIGYETRRLDPSYSDADWAVTHLVARAR